MHSLGPQILSPPNPKGISLIAAIGAFVVLSSTYYFISTVQLEIKTLDMGSICGKPSNKEPDHFATPGRTVGSTLATPSNPRSAVPKISSSPGQGQTLGGPNGVMTDPRSAAAKAAEVCHPRRLFLFAVRTCARVMSHSTRSCVLLVTSKYLLTVLATLGARKSQGGIAKGKARQRSRESEDAEDTS